MYSYGYMTVKKLQIQSVFDRIRTLQKQKTNMLTKNVPITGQYGSIIKIHYST